MDIELQFYKIKSVMAMDNVIVVPYYECVQYHQYLFSLSSGWGAKVISDQKSDNIKKK